jgi:hypothetical protein
MDGWQWLSGRVRKPIVASSIIAALAFVFASLYLFLWPSTAEAVIGIGPVTLTGIVVLNAFLVTTVVWTYLVSESSSITWKRLGVAGLVVGVVSHLTLGIVISTAFVLGDENGLLATGIPAIAELPELLGVWAGMSLVMGFYSIVITLGIPIFLSAGAGVGLARIHKGG